MQHDKNTKKIEQIAKVSKKEEEIASTQIKIPSLWLIQK